LIEAMYHGLVYGLTELLPDFGASLAIDGTAWQSVKKWFGYAIHVQLDSQYVLPVGFSVTMANASEVVEAHKVLDHLGEQHRQIVERCQQVAADRADDDGKLICEVGDDWHALLRGAGGDDGDGCEPSQSRSLGGDA
jgi:hypothetical protein